MATSKKSESKTQMYINRVAVTMTKTAGDSPTYEPFTHRSSLDHLDPIEVSLLLKKGIWEKVEDYDKRQAKES